MDPGTWQDLRQPVEGSDGLGKGQLGGRKTQTTVFPTFCIIPPEYFLNPSFPLGLWHCYLSSDSWKYSNIPLADLTSPFPWSSSATPRAVCVNHKSSHAVLESLQWLPSPVMKSPPLRLSAAQPFPTSLPCLVVSHPTQNLQVQHHQPACRPGMCHAVPEIRTFADTLTSS